MVIGLKNVYLALLVLQNTINILIMKYSLKPTKDGRRYLSGSLIFSGEVLKTAISIFMIYYIDSHQKLSTFKQSLINVIKISTKHSQA